MATVALGNQNVFSNKQVFGLDLSFLSSPFQAKVDPFHRLFLKPLRFVFGNFLLLLLCLW